MRWMRCWGGLLKYLSVLLSLFSCMQCRLDGWSPCCHFWPWSNLKDESCTLRMVEHSKEPGYLMATKVTWAVNLQLFWHESDIINLHVFIALIWLLCFRKLNLILTDFSRFSEISYLKLLYYGCNKAADISNPSIMENVTWSSLCWYWGKR